MNKRFFFIVSILIVMVLMVTACGTTTPEPTEEPAPAEEAPAAEEPTDVPVEEPASSIDCMGASSGDEVTVLYQWSGAEEEKFNAAIAPVVEACGITVVPESSRDQAVLDTRISSGDPWDLVFWPTTGPMVSYADQMVPLADSGAHAENYEDYWIELGTAGGAWLGVPVKADIKSIIWYSPLAFEASGYTVPTSFDDLDALVEQMVADGVVPWSMGMESGDATGWTGSDFIQDLLLAMQGPEYVLGIIDGSVPYNDAGVQAAYEQYYKWAADPLYTVGGAEGTLSTGFMAAIYKPFADPAEAMMVKQSGFAGGAIAEQFPELVYGEDYDFFAFPGAQGMQGGADWMMVFNASPAAQAIISYLTSTEGAQNWASVGFDLSPNKQATGSYTDVQLGKKAEALAAASGFTPDMGDTIPNWGSAEWEAIVDVVSGASPIDVALDNAAEAQAESLGGSVAMEIDCMGAAAGDEVTLLYQWSGAEEENFNAILQPLVDECGISVVPESSRDQAVLDTRVSAGDPWDIVIWPSTGPVTTYGDQLVALDSVGAHEENYRKFWVDLGSADAGWLAVPVKADIKSIIWYSPLAFEAAGYAVPTTFDGLDALVEQMVADGVVPWSMGMESGDATGWTASDFIQDLLLAMEGPEYVLGIIDGSVPYDDAGVQAAYEQYFKWAADPLYTVGGAEGTLSTSFTAAIYKPFADPAEAMMVKQSGFAGGTIAEQYPELVYGEDYDFFAFPGAQGMQGGADWMMSFSDSPAAQAVIAYLTSRTGAQNWASVGFDLSPNNHATRAYENVQLQKKALALATAAGFTPDMGDTIPNWGSSEWKAIVDVVSGAADIPTALKAAADAQAESLAE